MKKFVYALAVCLAACLPTGCSDNDDPDPLPDGEKVTLTEAGTLRTVLGDRVLEIKAISVQGLIDDADLLTLAYASFDGELVSIDLSGAQIQENTIPDYAFCWCINGDVTSVDARPANFMDDIPGQTPKFTRFVFPKNLEKIDAFAFGFTRIEKLDFPSGLREIGTGAFTDCDHIRQDILIFPEGFESVGMGAFKRATLKDVVLPQSLKTIGYEAFDNCISGNIYSKSLTPPLCSDESVFRGCENSTLYVPVGAKEAYSNAKGWSGFAKIVETKDFPKQR